MQPVVPENASTSVKLFIFTTPVPAELYAIAVDKNVVGASVDEQSGIRSVAEMINASLVNTTGETLPPVTEQL